MMAFPSVRNLELRSLFEEVLSISGSRSPICLPRKFLFCRPKLKYGSWTNASFKSKVVPPVLVTAAEEEEAKVVLHKFLREQGFSSALATTTIEKSDLFIAHLVSRICSLQNTGSPVGHKLTAPEMRIALIPYLESLLEDYGCDLVDFLENFPNSPAKAHPVTYISSVNVIDSKKLKALSRVTETGPDGQLPPHILYLLELGMDIEQIKKIVYTNPSFAYLSLDGKIRPLVEFLLSVGVPNSDISTVFVKAPSLSFLSLSGNIIPTMKLLENFGLDKRRWPRVLRMYPNIICCSRRKLQAAVDFFYEMGLSATGIGKVLGRFPQIAGCSVENNLRPTAEYLRSLGIPVNVMLLRWPQTFALSIEGKLKPTTEFFLAVGYSMEEIEVMFSRFGGVYTINLSKNLIPKWEFLLTMNYSKKELVRFPLYLGHSLERRIKPRYAIMKASGVEFPLGTLVGFSDARFNQVLKNRLEKKALADASVAEIHL